MERILSNMHNNNKNIAQKCFDDFAFMMFVQNTRPCLWRDVVKYVIETSPKFAAKFIPATDAVVMRGAKINKISPLLKITAREQESFWHELIWSETLDPSHDEKISLSNMHPLDRPRPIENIDFTYFVKLAKTAVSNANTDDKLFMMLLNKVEFTIESRESAPIAQDRLKQLQPAVNVWKKKVNDMLYFEFKILRELATIIGDYLVGSFVFIGVDCYA